MGEQVLLNLLSNRCLAIGGGPATGFALRLLIRAGVGSITLLAESDQDLDALSGDLPTNTDVALEAIRLPNDTEVLEQMVTISGAVIESSFDWQLKLKLSDTCMRAGVPLIHSGSTGASQQVYTMVPGVSACLRCVFPACGIDDFPLTRVDNAGLLALSSWAGSIMGLDAIKILGRVGVFNNNELWRLDGLRGELDIIGNLNPARDCPDCGAAGRL